MQTSYRIALACGAAPLAAGVSFYLFWLLTRWPMLSKVAVSVIALTILLVLLGCVALARFAWQALRSKDVPRDQAWKAIAIAATLLSANLPVTAGLVGQVLPK